MMPSCDVSAANMVMVIVIRETDKQVMRWHIGGSGDKVMVEVASNTRIVMVGDSSDEVGFFSCLAVNSCFFFGDGFTPP